jgi:NADH-quinone oxidoreductase subunit E
MSQIFKPVEFEQPISFAFSMENMQKAQNIIARYPEGKQRSAVMPLLYLAQKQHGNWVPKAAMDVVADMLNMPPMHVYEVAHFYTMYNKQPVGKYLIQVCRTTPCWLNGADIVTRTCRKKLGIDVGESTSDGHFTLVEVECLGACVNGPVVQINDDYYENLSEEEMLRILDKLQK